MSSNNGEFGKRVRNSNAWDEDEELDDTKPTPNSKSPINKRVKIDIPIYNNDHNKETEEDDDEEILFGNKISLEESDYKRKLDTDNNMIEIPKQEIEILKLEVSHFEKDIDKKGIESLSTSEIDEYEMKKKLLGQLERSEASESYILPDDYVTEEGKIDLLKKAEALKKTMRVERKQREQEWYDNQINRAQKVNQLSKLKKDSAVDNEEKEYEYVFDKSQMINYVADIPEDELKELENKVELEELIEKEEKRVRSIEETKRSLPVYEYKDELLEAIEKYPVLIVVGETGSGKTTQLPQYLYEAGYGKGGKMIGCTQPRRVAAVSVASRVADEVGTKVGDKVGYSIRFDEKSGNNTRIKYMTDGMLVREFLTDGDLEKYSVMIIDEAHERTLQTDILLGLLKELLKRRSDFKLIISSATINAKKFSDYFDAAPIFNVPGRRYPVEIFYTEQPEANYLYAAITTVFQIHMSQKNGGDILVFLTGQDEIENMAERLNETCKKLEGQIKEMIVCPIYANLPAEQQKKIFEPTPKGARKVVISTNIAETSLTIDGIVYVIDCGFVKENIYNPTTGMESLEVIPCSRASADQRAGRAGRVGPGKCFRLYTKWAYLNELPSNAKPEILRTDLTSVVLLMMTLGITDLIHFDFMDKPSTKALVKALELLYVLGALNERGELTHIGVKMAMLPTKVMLSKSLLESGKLNCCDEVLSIICMMEDSGSSLYVTPRERKEMAKNAHARFVSRMGGDPLTLLEVWRQFEASGYSPQWCHDNFVQYKTLVRARKVRRQLERIARRLGLLPGAGGAGGAGGAPDEGDPHRRLLCTMKALAAGLFPQSARLCDAASGRYETVPGGVPVAIHPASAVAVACSGGGGPGGGPGGVPPGRVVFAELVQTSRGFLRHVMPVQGKWLAEYGRNYLDRAVLE